MKDNLDEIFKKLENQFDIEVPTIGHFDRFQTKLNKTEISTKKQHKNWFPFIAIAASFMLLFGVWLGASFFNKGMDLAAISPKMEETQSYFLATIQKELETIKKERNSDTEQVINDALIQLTKLEKEYNTLTFELKESTEDKRIIYAMISNFQQRIAILQSLMTQIENVKQLKIQKNEKYV